VYVPASRVTVKLPLSPSLRFSRSPRMVSPSRTSSSDAGGAFVGDVALRKLVADHAEGDRDRDADRHGQADSEPHEAESVAALLDQEGGDDAYDQ
jgi:hypothetical protein